MRNPSRGRRTAFSLRRGFTLVELLVAIAIISVLIALLLPAIWGARQNVRVAQVQAEISQLTAAVGQFKSKYGKNPPSSVTLSEAAAGWTPENIAIVRSYWPQFDFSIDRDINNDTDTTDTHELTKGECLVFFLGGVPDSPANGFAPKGFSANPANPFLIAGANREGPYFTFDIGRYVDLDADGMPEYVDTLPEQTQPYFYLSAYDGEGYRAAEAAPMTDVYLQAGTSAWNPQSFQIISPGADAAYGTGGVFNADTADADLTGPRFPERDNITNFHSGLLAPN